MQLQVFGGLSTVSGSSAMAGIGVLLKGSSTIYLRFVFGMEVVGILGMDRAGVTGFDLLAESR